MKIEPDRKVIEPKPDPAQEIVSKTGPKTLDPDLLERAQTADNLFEQPAGPPSTEVSQKVLEPVYDTGRRELGGGFYVYENWAGPYSIGWNIETGKSTELFPGPEVVVGGWPLGAEFNMDVDAKQRAAVDYEVQTFYRRFEAEAISGMKTSVIGTITSGGDTEAHAGVNLYAGAGVELGYEFGIKNGTVTARLETGVALVMGIGMDIGFTYDYIAAAQAANHNYESWWNASAKAVGDIGAWVFGEETARTIGDAGDAAAETVGDVAGDAVDAVNENVVDPIVDTAEDVAEDVAETTEETVDDVVEFVGGFF